MISSIYIRLDNVQFARGFLNRVQVKTASGLTWLTVPLKKPQNRVIAEVELDDSQDWRSRHLETLRRTYANAPYGHDALAVAEDVLIEQYTSLGDLGFASVKRLVRYFSVEADLTWLDARDLGVETTGSKRIKDLVTRVNAKTYITGRGALNYLNHEEMESHGIDVRYMNYQHLPWPQRFGNFTPFVTSLDLIANAGPGGLDFLQSRAESWRDVHNERR